MKFKTLSYAKDKEHGGGGELKDDSKHSLLFGKLHCTIILLF